MATGRIGTTPVLQVRWSKAPTGGTTSLSGLDDNSVSLVYSVGYEAVYRNGVLLSRGNDYTATDGTTITLTDATITGDIIEIFANQTIPLSDTFSQTVADGRFIKNTLTTTTGDIIYASGANTPARLGIGSSAQVLTVSGGIPAWTTPAGGGFTLLSTATLSNNASFNFTSISQDYKHLFMRWEGLEYSNGGTAENFGAVTINNIATSEYDFRAIVWDDSASPAILKIKSGNALTSFCGTTDKYAQIFLPGYGNGFSFPQTASSGEMWFWNYKDTTTDGRIATWRSDSINQFTGRNYFVVGRCGSKLDTAISRIDVTASGGTFYGKCLLYGVS